MLDNNTILILLVCAAAVYYFFYYKTEHFSDETQSIIDKVYNYINANPKGEFVNYVNFLTSIGNTNLPLIDSDVHNTFKTLMKLNQFTKQSVIDEMKLN